MIKIIFDIDKIDEAKKLDIEKLIYEDEYYKYFIFDEYEIITKDLSSDKDMIYFIVEGDLIYIKALLYDKKWVSIKGRYNDETKIVEVIDINEVKIYFMNELKYNNKKAKNNAEKYFQRMMGYWISIRCYIMKVLKERGRIIKESKQKNENSSKNKTKKKNEPYVYENKEIFLFDELIEYLTSPKGRHIIKCQCWTVRGHIRHYKNGKEVFIRSYKKGKNKDLYPSDKVYKTFIDG